MKNYRILIASFLFASFFSNSITSQADIKLPKGVQQGAVVEGMSEYLLDNGMRVLLFPDQSKNTITVNVTYMVGSRHEGYGETGMAHLLEHLVFKGTPNHPNIPAELTEHGCRPNGTTWYDRTNYFETFTSTEENLKWAIDMEADRMVNSFIAKKDLDSEMTVVRNEFERGENNPSSVLMKRAMGAAFQWHNYGKSTIGARADIENVPIDRLKAFYKKYYQPDNSTVLVAGKFEPQMTLDLIQEKFGAIPRPERVLIPTYTKEPTQDGERLVKLNRVGDIQTLSCIYHTPPGPHKDYPAMAVIEELLTSDPSGRLYKSMVDTKLSPYLWGFAPGLKEGGFLYISADVRKENSIEEAKEIMLKTLDDVVNDPPSEEEVERAKATILKNWELAFNSSDRVGVRISESIAAGDWRLFFLFRDNVEKVSTADVVRVAKTYFVPSNRTIGMFIPEEDPIRAEIPDAPSIDLLVDGYKGREAVSEGEAFDPSPSNIESRTKRGVTKSGMEYAFLQKETRGDAVVASMRIRYGSPSSLMGKEKIADFTASMLDKGTAEMTRQEIKDKFDALKARVYTYGGKSGVTIRVETTNENLPEVMDMVGAMIKNPSIPQDEFEKLKEEEAAWLEEQLSDPQALANKALNKKLNPYPKSDVRYVMTMDEEIAAVDAVTIEDVKNFHKEFYGASEATLSVVGDFDEAIVTEKVEKYFGDWESETPYERIKDPYVEVKNDIEIIKTPDKSNSMFFAGMNVPVNDSHPDYAALVIGNYILGGGFLNSRLATRIRQKDGLSYGVGSWFNGSSEDDGGGFGAYAISAPENSEKVYAAFREEIEKVITEGFTAEELEAAKSGWLQSRNVTRSQDNRLTGKLSSYLRIDRTLEWDQALEDKINSMSIEDVNKAIKAHIHHDKMVYIRAGDFDKVSKEIKP